jgi:uncharacterized membrane protein HdeD (DUF308 family)
LILLGILAVVVGLVAIAWPGVTLLALVILFAIYAFSDAALQTMRAFSGRGAGPALGHLLLALIDLAAGAFAVAWPAPTVFVLVIVLAAWALGGGVAEFFAGFQAGESAGTRAVFFTSGLVSFASGVLLFSRSSPSTRPGCRSPSSTAPDPIPELRCAARSSRHCRWSRT